MLSLRHYNDEDEGLRWELLLIVDAIRSRMSLTHVEEHLIIPVCVPIILFHLFSTLSTNYDTFFHRTAELSGIQGFYYGQDLVIRKGPLIELNDPFIRPFTVLYVLLRVKQSETCDILYIIQSMWLNNTYLEKEIATCFTFFFHHNANDYAAPLPSLVAVILSFFWIKLKCVILVYDLVFILVQGRDLTLYCVGKVLSPLRYGNHGVISWPQNNYILLIHDINHPSSLSSFPVLLLVL